MCQSRDLHTAWSSAITWWSGIEIDSIVCIGRVGIISRNGHVKSLSCNNGSWDSNGFKSLGHDGQTRNKRQLKD